jgi:hypothetical protein
MISQFAPLCVAFSKLIAVSISRMDPKTKNNRLVRNRSITKMTLSICSNFRYVGKKNRRGVLETTFFFETKQSMQMTSSFSHPAASRWVSTAPSFIVGCETAADAAGLTCQNDTSFLLCLVLYTDSSAVFTKLSHILSYLSVPGATKSKGIRFMVRHGGGNV